MADPKIEEILAPLRASVKEQVWCSCLLLACIFLGWIIEITPDKTLQTIS
jgi:hypothetical protein